MQNINKFQDSLIIIHILVTFPRDFKINQQSVMCLKVLKS